MTYNWQQNDWLNFHFDLAVLEASLQTFSERAGKLSGLIEGLSSQQQQDTILDLMVAEAVKTSAIEGEFISRIDVMSSVKRNLGLSGDIGKRVDRRAKGAADLMTMVRDGFASPLKETDLFQWHAALLAGTTNMVIGGWRSHTEPMQVVSGPIGKEKVHYEAPPSIQIPGMMSSFIDWFNRTAPNGSEPILRAPIRSGIAHLYFESLHPFEDGNGRIGRAISEKALSQNLGRPVLFSLSQAIERKRSDYYDALKITQSGNEITDWLIYFINTCLEAQALSETTIRFTLGKARYFDTYNAKLNERQRRAIERMFEEGPDGFKGGMSARKYVAITQTSKATATRDLAALAEIGALIPIGSGRSHRYDLPPMTH